MFILIDNYDSFTYNLYHYLGELGAEIEVHRNDKITVDEVLAKHDETYMPPEVAKALKASGRWQETGGKGDAGVGQ